MVDDKSDNKVVPIRREKVIAEVGGVVDESDATLAVYGKDLEPDDVTALLGIKPTRSFRRGHKVGPNSPPIPHGAWFLEIRGEAPEGPDVQLRKLLMRLPDSEDVWRKLRSRYEVQLRFGIFMSGWNKGFDLAPDLIVRLAKMGVELDFSIWANGDEEENGGEER
ncbi:MAG: DUF4279 domain-containing protein [Deltaproteobacteria bacterium]|nr:MAG: DUF4279 domain-containing protein [Deltaproteobacteria bacterium]